MRRLLVLLTTILGVVMAMLANFMVGDALPEIEDSLGTGSLELRWIENVYLVTFLALMLAGGALADRFGRKATLVWGLVVFTAASAAGGLSQTFDQLLAARAVQGIGAALLVPAALATLAESFGHKGRGAVLGLWSAASATALVYGPLAGGYLLDRADWTWLFYGNVVAGLLALLLAAAVKESRDRSLPRRLDVAGLIFGVPGLALLSYALVEGNPRGWSDRNVVGALGASALLLLVFLIIATRRRQPIVSLRFSGHSTFSAANAVAALAFFALYGVGVHFAAYLRNVLGLIPDQAALRLLPFAGALVLAAPLAGRRSDRAGSRGLMAWGCLVAAAALGLLLRAGLEPSYQNDLLPALVLLGFGMALIVGPMTTAVTGVVDPDKLGGASGANNTARQLGLLLAIALSAAVVSSAFENSFEDNLISAQVDPNVARSVAEATGRDVAGGAALEPLVDRMPPGTAAGVVEGVVPAARESLVDAVHSGMLLSIGFMLLAGLISLIFVRSHVISLFKVEAQPPTGRREKEPEPMEQEPAAPVRSDPTPTPQAAAPAEEPPSDEPVDEPEVEPAPQDVSIDEPPAPAAQSSAPPADFNKVLFQFPFRAGSGSVVDNITDFIRAALDFYDEPGVSPAPQVPLPEPLGSSGTTASADIATLTGYLLLEQRFARINPDIRPELAATALIGAARSMKLWTFSDGGTDPGDDFLQGMIGVVMEGIGPVPPPGPARVEGAPASEPPLSA
ncbi:MAG TPA: DHA2 family efflux MFS transporter permease subunit [Actinomycetota bacterium]|nr:DHA2 family efflux MFS transporter permease subunit [Actinomycetota bacterium]